MSKSIEIWPISDILYSSILTRVTIDKGEKYGYIPFDLVNFGEFKLGDI
jgi:hypothetical protein